MSETDREVAALAAVYQAVRELDVATRERIFVYVTSRVNDEQAEQEAVEEETGFEEEDLT